MAQARPFKRGTTYLVTRRTVQRQFLINPSRQINEILLYCMAYAAARHRIEIHAFCFLSNHYHLVLTDPDSQLPDFMAWLNKITSKCLNASYGRWGALWEPSVQYSAVILGDAEAVVEKIVYTLLNPVEAGLVKSGDHWPGLRTRAQDVGAGEYTAQRPLVFFREDGNMPEMATLRLVPPPAGEVFEEFHEQLETEIEQRESDIQSRVKGEGKTFLGVRRVLAQSPRTMPTTYERRRTLNPCIACRDTKKRVKLLDKLKEFLADYRDALQRFIAGERDVVFPYGTYLMRVKFQVECEPT